ncbi:SGNH/GDSL hydrolase family protein [Pseudidiomarina sp.]|uniref:SGNH/GDSL hydrolase family protein n=1 Tax=Pseudidiomarina sp. TaxID=2081707 RepID=UPI00299D53D4|nr:SGNH/GDSL hydrolase family protein [Pseudidiomarina sp.]MDX1706057.1 SGNH/GDSL hydrolase family protein [Pseudidiomarina sp.]
MLPSLLAVPLAPWLISQGRRVRRETPRLAEPAGPRTGKAGSGPPLRLLITGDSAAAGVGTDCIEEALTGQLLGNLQQHFSVQWQLLAQSGLSCAELLAWLHVQKPAAFDAAVVSVGVNDVTGNTGVGRWRRNLIALCRLLEQHYGVRQIILTAVPPMDKFPALPQPLRWFLGGKARQLNAVMASVAQNNPLVEQLKFELPFAPEYMAADGFHPSAAACSLWGTAAATAIADSFSD